MTDDLADLIDTAERALAELRQRLADGERVVLPFERPVTLSKLQWSLLQVLGSNPARRFKQEEVIEMLPESFSLGTVGPALASLRQHGLTYRPAGKRGGEAITPRGLQLLSSQSPGYFVG